MDLISVIVPVYKTEAYLDKCIESIVGQTYKNLEIILVDDGSPDNCPSICDSWAKRDSRIKVLHISNGGAGNARNIGIATSTGKWISFVDSDDYVAENFYEHLMRFIEEDVDVVECGYLLTNKDDSDFDNDQSKPLHEMSALEALESHINNKFFKQVVWNKLYRKQIICDIKFPEGKMIDDEFWTYQAIANAKKLVSTELKLYAYRQQDQSVMHIPFSLKRLQALEAKQARLVYIKGIYPSLSPLVTKDLWLTCLYMGQMCLLYLKEDETNDGFKMINDVLSRFPLTRDAKKALAFDYKLWAIVAKVSVRLACKLRNLLKLGI